MPEEKNEINELIKGLKGTIEALNSNINQQNERIGHLENKLSTIEQYDKKEIPKSVLPPPPPPPPPPPQHIPRPSETVAEKVGDKIAGAIGMDKFTEQADEHKTHPRYEEDGPLSPTAPSSPPPPPLTKEEKDQVITSLEERIGAKWFAKIGIVVLILGVSFFLKYAFDNDWVGPVGRVIIGIFTGVSLLVWGEKTIRKYSYYGQIVTGGGLAILYLSIYAALNFYHLIPHVAAFAFMALVTAIGVALSLRYNAPTLMIGTILGGFATPYLVSSGENNQAALFVYIIILDLAILAVSVFKRWRWLHLIGFVGTIAVFDAWFIKFYTSDQIFSTFLFLTVFFIIYSISALIYNLVKKENSSGIEQLMTLVSGLVYFSLSYNLLDKDYHIFMGLFAVLLGIYYFIWAYLVRIVTPKDENMYNFLAFLTVGFVTIAIPIQFKAYVITILWLVEATLLLSLGAKLRDKTGEIIKIFGFVVFGLGLVRILTVDYRLYHEGSRLFLNKVFLTSLLAIAASYILAYFYYRYQDKESKESSIFNYNVLVTVFLILASVLTVFSVSRDIDKYHDNIINAEYKRVNEANKQITERYGTANEYREKVDFKAVSRLRERNNASIVLFWLIYGMFVLIGGLYSQRRALTILSLALVVISLVHIFAYDMWQMKTGFRMLMWLIAILSSYFVAWLFHEYRDTIEDDDFIASKKLIIIFLVTANVMTIIAVSREIFLHFDKQVDSLRTEQTKVCTRSYSKFSKLTPTNNMSQYDEAACTEIREQVQRAENQASVAMSLYWLLYSIVLLVVGFWRRYKWVRIGGVALLIIAIIKLFFVDLWNLGQLYRIIASISLGLVLLGISFMYHKYRDVFKDIIED